MSLSVRLSCCVCVRRISLGGEGNALYPVLSGILTLYMCSELQRSFINPSHDLSHSSSVCYYNGNFEQSVTLLTAIVMRVYLCLSAECRRRSLWSSPTLITMTTTTV